MLEYDHSKECRNFIAKNRKYWEVYSQYQISNWAPPPPAERVKNKFDKVRDRERFFLTPGNLGLPTSSYQLCMYYTTHKSLNGNFLENFFCTPPPPSPLLSIFYICKIDHVAAAPAP